MSSLRERRGTDVNLRSGPQMREYAALADRIAADRPGRLLDWGCGWGQVTALLLERGVDVHAFDYRPDEDGVGEARLERYPEIACTFSPEPVSLPFEDASFDAVLSCGVLEHVQDPGGSLAELHRVLRTGGRLYVTKLPNRRSYLEWLAKRLGLYYHGQLPHDTLWSPREAREAALAHGFDVTDVRLANMLPLTLDHPLAARLAAPIWRLNSLLSRVPGLNRLATNVELDAVRR
jgi:2-polyprenyl-3-methyl-5-hydroxy-6-metoxy-1,4-benzoquinol methylase